MTIADIRPPEDLERLMKDVQEVRSHPGAYRNSQWRHMKKNGEIIDVEITRTPHRLRRTGRADGDCK